MSCWRGKRAKRSHVSARGLSGLLVLVCIQLAPAAAAEWGAHGLVAVGYDSNPEEHVDQVHRRADLFSRLEAGMLFYGGVAGGAISTELRWGTDRYLREERETRHLVRGSLRWQRQTVSGGYEILWTGLRRLHPHDPLYKMDRQEVGIGGQRRFSSALTLRGGLSAIWLRRDSGAQSGTWDCGERNGWNLVLELHRGVWRGWRLFGRVDASRIDHERPAVEWGQDGLAIALNESERDLSLLAGLGIGRTGSPMVRLLCALRRNWSNSYGVAFRRARFDLVSAWRLPLELSLVLSGRLEPWEWREDEERLVDPSADPDDPEFGARNSMTVRLLRPLAGGLTAEVQFGWQQNEWRLPWDRYEKTTLLGAIRYSKSRGSRRGAN